MSKEGTTKLETWSSIDGSSEQHKSASIRIDTIAPRLEIRAQATYDDQASIGATAFDAASGLDLDSMEWSLDGSAWTSGFEATIPWPGRYTLRFKIADLAGNETQESTPVVVTAASSATLGTPPVRTPAWGASVKLTGTVVPAPSAPATVAIEARTAGAAAWVRVSRVMTDADGRFTASRQAESADGVPGGVRRRWRLARGLADARRRSSPQNPGFRPFPVRAEVVRAGTALRLSGRVVPGHSSAIYLVIEKPSGGGWVKSVQRRVTLRADGRGGSTWSLVRTLPRGSWRLRVYHAYDSRHAASYSGVEYVRVR